MTYSLYYCDRTGTKDNPIDVDFVDWMTQVENIVFNYLRIDILNLPDQMYMHAYENNTDPKDFAMYIVSQYEDYF
jgi:hypothetical protein